MVNCTPCRFDTPAGFEPVPLPHDNESDLIANIASNPNLELWLVSVPRGVSLILLLFYSVPFCFMEIKIWHPLIAIFLRILCIKLVGKGDILIFTNILKSYQS